MDEIKQWIEKYCEYERNKYHDLWLKGCFYLIPDNFTLYANDGMGQFTHDVTLTIKEDKILLNFTLTEYNPFLNKHEVIEQKTFELKPNEENKSST